MLDGYIETAGCSDVSEYYGFYDMGSSNVPRIYSDTWSNVWSLYSYRQQAGDDKGSEKWDELEKSIIANLADDVIVGVIGKNVDIIIKKNFTK